MEQPAILAEGLVKHFGDVRRARRRRPRGADRHRVRPARAQRRRQDHRRAHPHHDPAPRRRAAPRSSASTSPSTRTRCARSIGLAGQYAAVDENLTGRENLHHGRAPHAPAPDGDRAAGRRAARAVRPRRRRRPTGARPTRAACAAASTSRPPWCTAHRCCSSTSPPPASIRAAGWTCGRLIEELVADGATLLLTTQYLEEADRLADRIAVVDHGRVIAEGTGRRAEGPARQHDRPRRAGRARRDVDHAKSCSPRSAPPTWSATGTQPRGEGARQRPRRARRRAPARRRRHHARRHSPCASRASTTCSSPSPDARSSRARPSPRRAADGCHHRPAPVPPPSRDRTFAGRSPTRSRSPGATSRG